MERTGELHRVFPESNVVHLGEVFRLTDQQMVPVYHRLCPVHTSPMLLHLPFGHFNATLWAWYLSL